ncbi:tryptophan--tRNA ligase [Halalkalicoccus paucihalophilus]|uniref:Tryptophan--tRNA ligase n=1 Tax=Halalkalicoccus paucihalophilus TaxID=1008153 RepID=A0A151A9L6_9EURY|nr:tryptophan--tRNA ligase [Halalkalicoccus paucihalophilus]KYH24250.1 tryptophan--tRNA ligase [Halalkalicoccus paucihalophilus]
MPANPDDFTVTPYAVEGEIDYDRLLEQFGADRLTDAQIARFPEPVHPLVRRKVFYAQRDVEPFLEAATSGQTHSIVTGRGPSGSMHIGHIAPFYFAKYLQDQTGALVYIPLSDDEKYFAKDKSIAEISTYTRENLREILAIGFDPNRTRIIIDTTDADVIYPLAAAFATEVTQSTVDATYGTPENIGLSFYPAIQATHLLLPQLVEGPHSTLVPIAVDQDPHVRLCRDIAAKQRYDVMKPGALLSKFLPSLEGPGKMSSSSDTPSILLSDDRETVREKVRTYAYSGGQSSVEAHREHGGNPEVDVSYQFLYYFFEESDERVEQLAREYRDGALLSGKLKEIAATKIADFLEGHQKRRAALGSLDEELRPYRITANERQIARQRVGYSDGLLI